ncbi:type IV secretion system protein VirB10 [Trinickia symbiotica]|uniref:type IV secretion system protein VirB10 n=1 Tax=Trinickia symbiotica TaxID=863227 RepID=UPI002690A3D9
MNDPLSQDGRRNAVGPDEPAQRGPRADDPDASQTSQLVGDRGMPALGQYRSARPRAWWLTPVLIILVAGTGAVWTVHAYLARHDAQAKARRDAIAQTPTQGRLFKDVPSSPANSASMPVLASAATVASAPVANRLPVPVMPAAPVRSYYDAPLLVTGGTSSANDQGSVAARDAAGSGAGTASSMRSWSSGGKAGSPDQNETGSLAQALAPTPTPRVVAGTLGNRNLTLAQGAKIDCVGDTAFDSTEAGLSTCTVTKNVYSDDGKVVLIERGSQINSQYRSNLSPGQKRAFILAARIKTPHGVTVEIDSPAADALGRMGIDGYVDNHWRQRIGAAMLLGMTQDAIGYLATRGGDSNGSVVYENTQQQGNDMATRVLSSTINIPPTLTQNQGAEFTIVLARDIDFESVYALQPEGAQ